jgi:hypothetical protein
MFKKYNIKSYALIVGLATTFFLPITADADRAADQAMREDGLGFKSTRGNNSVADSLKQADRNLVVAPPEMAPRKMHPGGVVPRKMHPGGVVPGKMHPGGVVPGTFTTGGDSSASADCSQTPDDGWQSVTEVRSEADFQIGFNDAVAGRQFSKFENDSSIVCVAGDVKNVYVGVAPSDSNLGTFIGSSMGCNLRNDDLSSGGRGVDKLICP